MLSAQKPVEYARYESGSWSPTSGQVIVEQPVSLTVNGDTWMSFMCTPTNLEALAVGFLYNEGVISSYAELLEVRPCASGDNIDVWLERSVEPPRSWRRTSGCTGGVTAVEDTDPKPVSTASVYLEPAQVGELIGKLFASQDLYRTSGGVHTSALSDGQEIILSAEDIGRHNTLDKLTGLYIMEKPALSPTVVLTTGRISSEMLQKSARIGAEIVISRTSPSSLSLEMAEKRGLTLIGYAHRNRFIVYTHPGRVGLANPVSSNSSRTLVNQV